MSRSHGRDRKTVISWRVIVLSIKRKYPPAAPLEACETNPRHSRRKLQIGIKLGRHAFVQTMQLLLYLSGVLKQPQCVPVRVYRSLTPRSV